MNTIIVPTDFSDHAFKALQYAGTLANVTKAKIIIFHNVPIIPSLVEKFSLGSQVLTILNIYEKKLKDLISLLRREINFWYEVEILCVAGSFIKNLKDLVFEKKADLVVMGKKGEKSVLEKLICGTTAGYLKKAICPVLIVPQNTLLKLPKSIAYVTGSKYNDNIVLNQLVPFVQAYKSNLTLVSHTWKTFKDDQLLCDIEDQLPNARLTISQLPGANSAEALEGFVEDNEINLLTVSMPKPNYLGRLIHTNLFWELVYGAAFPLLVLPEESCQVIHKKDMLLVKVAS